MATRTNERHSLVLAEEVYRLVGRTRRSLWLTAARNLEARGESVFAWQIVSYLVRNGATTQRELAYALAQHPGGISRQVGALEEDGLVRRRTVTDFRKLLVEPTPEGRSWYAKISPAVMAEVNDVLGSVSEGQRRELVALLKTLLASVDDRVAREDGATESARSVAARATPQALPVTRRRRSSRGD